MATTTQNGRPIKWETVYTTEQGSAYQGEDRLFHVLDDGKLFLPADVDERAIDEMLRLDGKAKTLEQVLTLPARWADWSIEPADDDSGEAKFVRDAIERPANAGGMTTPIDLVIAQMTNAVLYRRAYFEKVFMVEGGRVRYRKLAYRHPRTCWLWRDPNDYGFRGFKQRFVQKDGSEKKVEIKAPKALVYIHGQHRDPLNGITDLETAYAAFESKQKVRFLWFQLLENFTLPKGKAQVESEDEQAAKQFAQDAAGLKGGGIIGLTRGQSLEPFESSRSDAGPFRDAMDYLSSEMSGSVLAGFTDLPASDARGSYALSKDQTDFFLNSRQAVLTEMGATLTSWAVADLVRWNFGPGAAVPTFKFHPLAEGARDEALALFKDLASSQSVNPTVPREFIDLLTERVASVVDLDVDAVHNAIKTRQDQAATPGGELRAGIDAATKLVASARLNGDG